MDPDTVKGLGALPVEMERSKSRCEGEMFEVKVNHQCWTTSLSLMAG
jgi:hypothetical protein